MMMQFGDDFEESCLSVLNTMQVSKDELSFALTSDRSATVKLPYRMVSGKYICTVLCNREPDSILKLGNGRCTMTIRTMGLADTWSWYQFWEVGLSLAGMCARVGMAGTSVYLGKIAL